MAEKRKRVLIVGGVAGGASAAARLRRLCETAEILVFDRGPYVSFANCGLPYYVGDVITDEKKLLVASAALFRSRFNIQVFTEHDVTAIDRTARTITVTDLATQQSRTESYDALVLSPGAGPVRPPVPGIDLPGVFSVRTIPDSRAVREWIATRGAQRALVVGGGFIGLEMAENLVRRGLSVTLLEKAPQVMPPLDPEMAIPVARALTENGVSLRLGEGIAGFELASSHDGPAGVAPGLLARTDLGQSIAADIVILAVGVRPETRLAAAAGLPIGPSGGIVVDASMRTGDPSIWAVGDAVETTDALTGRRQVVPLAGPANRQGRIAAESICGRTSSFRGVQGTAVCGAFGLTIAMTGASEKSLRRAGDTDFAAVHLHPGHHVGYYPGAKPIHLKLLFRKSDGRVLGAQAVGQEGTEKRIDVISLGIQLGAKVQDLAEAELCYAPQFGAAKDPVNLAGFIAENVRRGDMPTVSFEELGQEGSFLLDVREPAECAQGMVPGATNIPLNELRGRVAELPKDRPIHVYCAVGQRGYYAVRLLKQHGLDARNYAGGITTYLATREARAGT